MKSPEERYRTDAHFHALVDALRAELERARFTPTELREAVILAATIQETRLARTWPTAVLCAEPVAKPVLCQQCGRPAEEHPGGIWDPGPGLSLHAFRELLGAPPPRGAGEPPASDAPPCRPGPGQPLDLQEGPDYPPKCLRCGLPEDVHGHGECGSSEAHLPPELRASHPFEGPSAGEPDRDPASGDVYGDLNP